MNINDYENIKLLKLTWNTRIIIKIRAIILYIPSLSTFTWNAWTIGLKTMTEKAVTFKNKIRNWRCDCGKNISVFINLLSTIRGRRVIGISGFLIWPKPWWHWYLILVLNFGEVRMVQLAKYTLHSSTPVPLESFQIF